MLITLGSLFKKSSLALVKKNCSQVLWFLNSNDQQKQCLSQMSALLTDARDPKFPCADSATALLPGGM